MGVSKAFGSLLVWIYDTLQRVINCMKTKYVGNCPDSPCIEIHCLETRL